MTKHHTRRPVKPRRAKNGRFASKPEKGTTLSEMVDYNSLTPATEAPRELTEAATRCTPPRRHWLIRVWRRLTGARP